MCHCNGKSLDHLLIHCAVAYLLWGFVLRSFGVTWVLQERVLDLLMDLRNWLGKHLFDIWNVTPLMCCIWRESNNCMLEDIECSRMWIAWGFISLPRS